MARSTFLGTLGVIGSMVFPTTTPLARQPLTLPLAVEQVRVAPPAREGVPEQIVVTVRNTGARAIEAWGVSGEVRYANGATWRIGGHTDAYEMTSLPEFLRPVSGNTRLTPEGRATLSLTVQHLPLTSPIDAAVVPTFAVFDDDTAIGDEASIEFVFSRRRVNQRAWRIADETLSAALTQGATPDQAFAATVAALEAAGDEVTQSIPFSIIRRSLSTANPQKFDRLRTEIVSRRAAAERHAERRR